MVGHPRRVALLAAAGTVLVMGMAACGSSTGANPTGPAGGGSAVAAPAYGEPAGAPEQSALKIAVLPLVDFSAVYYAQDKGLFKAEGLEVTLQPVQGAAAAVPGLQSGDLQFSIASLVSFVLAARQGVDLRLVADGTHVTPGMGAVVVPPDSPIQKPADLSGKTVAVNLLKTIGDLTTKATLDAQGIDYRGVKFVELPFTEMPGALQRGSVDAAFVTEPFVSRTKAAIGARTVLEPYTGPMANLPASGYMTTGKFASSHPRTVAAFQRAIEKASTALQDEQTVRAFVPTFTQVPPEAAKRIALPEFKIGLAAAGVQKTADLMAKYELIPARLDMNPFVGNR